LHFGLSFHVTSSPCCQPSLSHFLVEDMVSYEILPAGSRGSRSACAGPHLLARQHAHRHTHNCKRSARGRGTEHLAGNDGRIRSMQACCMSLPSRPSARARLARCAHEPVLVRWSLRVCGAARRRAGHAVVCNNTKGRRRGGPRGRGETQARALVLAIESVGACPVTECPST